MIRGNDLCGYCGALPVQQLKKGNVQKWIEEHETWRSPATHRSVIAIDQPTAALLKDLKQRGLFEETLVVFCTEFGRTPGVEGVRAGRDHHPYGFFHLDGWRRD